MYIHTNVEQFIVSDTWANMLIGYAFAISLRLMCGFIVLEPRSLLFAFIFVLLDFGWGSETLVFGLLSVIQLFLLQ